MSRMLVVVLVLGAGAGCAAKPSSQPVHRFELLTYAEPANASDPATVESEQCLFGSYAAATPVLLLSEKDSTTCSVTTGRVGAVGTGNGDCTVLVGAERCKGTYALGVIGARGAYRQVEPHAITDEATRARLRQAISTGRAVEMASSRWKDALDGRSFEPSIFEAFSWSELDGGPILVRLKVDGDAEGGPWVTVSHGEVGAMAGPFTMQVPSGFTLDGRSYLSISVAVCTECGGVGTEVHAVEGGRLRRVLESFANAN
ncbi:hypothetical protein [Anaeromyxobacter oryzae]|uniref:hypothetical protein n=1 Tax=Anaeromyxobacter oryzae TaxID=2918170 RepID=UPI0020BDD36F|nr:hypothetical protein [Anaeromyxobacter oryzae]